MKDDKFETYPRIIRRAEVMRRLGIGRTAFDRNFIATGRLQKINIGPRCVGFLETEVNELINELAQSAGTKRRAAV